MIKQGHVCHTQTRLLALRAPVFHAPLSLSLSRAHTRRVHPAPGPSVDKGRVSLCLVPWHHVSQMPRRDHASAQSASIMAPEASLFCTCVCVCVFRQTVCARLVSRWKHSHFACLCVYLCSDTLTRSESTMSCAKSLLSSAPEPTLSCEFLRGHKCVYGCACVCVCVDGRVFAGVCGCKCECVRVCV